MDSRMMADDHVEALTKKVQRMKQVGIALDEDIREDIRKLDKLEKKTGKLLGKLHGTSSAMDTVKRHEWLKMGKLILFGLFILALSFHYIHRLGLFSFLSAVVGQRSHKGVSVAPQTETNTNGSQTLVEDEQPL